MPDCPNLDAARDLLRACLAELGLPLSFTEREGDFPSPSVLVNGFDVTGASGDTAAACRLQLPTAEQIRTALLAATAAAPAACLPVSAGSEVADCCADQGNAIRVDRPQRAADLPADLRQVHQDILRHFAATGGAPGPAVISRAAASAGLHPTTALRDLAAADLVAVDAAGRLLAAYPFSPVPTAHVVTLGGVQVFAMCAIDALGMPFMLDTDAVITSTDPQTADPIQVSVTGGAATFAPEQAVIVYAATGSTGRSVDSCCSTINFFASTASAQVWTAAHPGLAATVLDQAAAVGLGRDIFGPLLTPAP